MATYIVLAKWTDQGIRQVDNVADRERNATSAAGSHSISHTVYFTLGEYDAVSIVEAATEEEAAAYVLEIGTHGNIRTSTMRAFTPSEFISLLHSRPKWKPPDAPDAIHAPRNAGPV